MVLDKDLKAKDICLRCAIQGHRKENEGYYMQNQNEQINPLVSLFGEQKCWINWKLEEKDGKLDKIPKKSNGQGNAKPNDPSTWSTFTDVDCVRGHFSGVGIMLNDKLLGIDLDHCIENGKVLAEVATFIEQAHTYTEISPSDTGLHIYLALTEPIMLERNKAPRGIGKDYEVYTNGRWFTYSANPWKESYALRTVTPEKALELLRMLGYPWKKDLPLQKEEKNNPVEIVPLTDEDLLKKMFASKNGTKIRRLYDGDVSTYGNDDSAADMALCSRLAFWTGRNAEQMERLWLNSPIGAREKTQGRKDYRDRTISKAIEGCPEVYSQNYSDSKEGKTVSIDGDTQVGSKSSQANVLLESIFNRKDIVLFHDEQQDGFISLDIAGHQEAWSCKSKAIKRWLSSEVYRTQKKAPGSEVIKSVLSVLEGKACFEGSEIRLKNRAAWFNGDLCYDLTNEKWQIIRMNKDDWEVVDNPPIIFKRYSHHKAQVAPTKNGDAKLFLKYVNLVNPEHRLLFLIFLISCFVPDFPHVMLVVFGAQGASKSTLSKLARLIVDPSLIEVASFPHSQKELVQALAHHYFLFFDNVSYISEDQSDTLCKAITGGGHIKRELYSDDDDVIYNFMRCIGVNGINLVTTRPDLLERSLLLELERIEPAERKTEKELYESFKKDLPSILGGIFDTLVKAIRIHPTIKLDSHHRMADWSLWGSAIAEALGHTKEEFLNAYQNNIIRQTEMLLNDNVVATAIITFMEDKEEWRGTPTQLLKALSEHAMFSNIDTREKYWPKGANSLSRKINELNTPLKQMGYLVTINTTGTERYVHVQKLSKNNTTKKDSTEEVKQPDDTDSIIPASPKQPLIKKDLAS